MWTGLWLQRIGLRETTLYDAFLIQRDLALLDQRGGTMVTMLLVVLDDWTERVHVVCLWRWGRASVVQWVGGL